jgi:two-component system nitrogen regulation response regulator GlnG
MAHAQPVASPPLSDRSIAPAPPAAVERTAALPRPPRAALPAHLELVALSGPDRGRHLALAAGDFVIGTAADAAFVLTDPAVSRHHLELRVRRGRVMVRDLGSRNGSYCGSHLFREISIAGGDVLRIGHSELQLLAKPPRLESLPSQRHSFGALRGRSLAMRALFARLELAAPSDATVLIEGETGVGKELCAEAIHAHSRRAAGPFVVCDLGAAGGGLFDSEIFGHVRGAFTGAAQDRAGVFERADGGTLFLDEVGDLPPPLQSRLLRALASRRVRRLGDDRVRDVDVRVIAASHRDLGAEVRAGRFRADLWRRLDVVRVRVPPLRERKEDLPLLVERLLASSGARLSAGGLAWLAQHDWPGNVRELSNALERALALLPASPAAVSSDGAAGAFALLTEAHLADVHGSPSALAGLLAVDRPNMSV